MEPPAAPTPELNDAYERGDISLDEAAAMVDQVRGEEPDYLENCGHCDAIPMFEGVGEPATHHSYWRCPTEGCANNVDPGKDYWQAAWNADQVAIRKHEGAFDGHQDVIEDVVKASCVHCGLKGVPGVTMMRCPVTNNWQCLLRDQCGRRLQEQTVNASRPVILSTDCSACAGLRLKLEKARGRIAGLEHALNEAMLNLGAVSRKGDE